MDQKVCEASKRLNALQHDRTQRLEKLSELTTDLDNMRIINDSDYDEVREQVI